MERKNRNVVRLTESRLKQIVAESVKKALKEWNSDDETAYDMNGNEIHMGDYVIWVDPETGRRAKYEVYDEPSSEMVRLANKYGECEAFPEECIVIKRSN